MQGKLSQNKNIGAGGEDLAVEVLKEKGFYVLARNVRYRTGEIDIVAKKGKELHFVEVKTRNSVAMCSPLDSINASKQKRIKMTAELFIQDIKNNIKNIDEYACIFSVISIDKSGISPQIECIFDAFI